MAIIRFSHYNEVDSFRRQFDRMFNEMASLNSSHSSNWKPAVELHDAQDHFVLKAQLPGLDAKDLDISVTREVVAIKGEYHNNNDKENKGLHYSEFRYGKFERAIKLPVAVQNDKVNAKFDNGILTLTLPKVEAAVNRVVKVNLGVEDNEALDAGNKEAEAN